jgi:hypothetical protein
VSGKQRLSSERRIRLLIAATETASVGLLLLTLAGYAGSWRYLELLSDYRPYLLGCGLVVLAGAVFPFWSRRDRTEVLRLWFLLLVSSLVNG